MLQKLTSNPKNVFFLDGIGGVLSALFLGVVLVRMEERIGMPVTVLYYLASIACVFAVYSMCCRFLVSAQHKPYLMAIAIANFMYSCTTFALVLYFYDQLTPLGIFYFVFELIVLAAVIAIEIFVISKIKEPQNDR